MEKTTMTLAGNFRLRGFFPQFEHKLKFYFSLAHPTSKQAQHNDLNIMAGVQKEVRANRADFGLGDNFVNQGKPLKIRYRQ
jgi:hypothetical protein